MRKKELPLMRIASLVGMTAVGRCADQREKLCSLDRRPDSMLLGATDPLERDRADHFEPQANVEIEGATVRRGHMEPGHEPITTMIPHQSPDQARSKTPATMCRMGADAADLGVAFEHQAFAAHRDQFTIRSHTVIRAHFTSPSAKKPRKREVCERDQLSGIGIGETGNLNRWIGRHNFLGQCHLKAFEGLFKTKLR